MSPSTSVAPPAATSPISISPTNFSSRAAYDAVRRVVRQANANAAAALQLKGQSVDDFWREIIGAPTASSPAAKAASAQTADEMWSEVLAKQKGGVRSAFSECRR